jgi:hypothetical protein
MFAFPKLILLILIVAVIWLGYRWRNGAAREVSRRGSAPRRSAAHTEDLAPCGVCGAYVTAAAPGCGKPDCPRPR